MIFAKPRRTLPLLPRLEVLELTFFQTMDFTGLLWLILIGLGTGTILGTPGVILSRYQGTILPAFALSILMGAVAATLGEACAQMHGSKEFVRAGLLIGSVLTQTAAFYQITSSPNEATIILGVYFGTVLLFVGALPTKLAFHLYWMRMNELFRRAAQKERLVHTL